jgi:hypothetical protein
MARVFAEKLAWRVLAKDTFDRHSPTQIDATGHGLANGLRELWRRTLSEGLRDSSDRTFTDFTLDTGEWIDLGVQPFRNHELAKLRTWVYGKPGPFEPGGVASKEELLARENTRLLDALVDAHARLLTHEDRALPGWQADSAAGQIRACALACEDPAALVELLTAL